MRVWGQICVLALGATYGWPFRTLSAQLDEALRPFIEAQQKMRTYQRIILVGGGSVAIEYAGVSVCDPTRSDQVTTNLGLPFPCSASGDLGSVPGQEGDDHPGVEPTSRGSMGDESVG